MQRFRSRLRRLLIAWSVLALILLGIFLLGWRGTIWFNRPSKRKYPVRGVDVSHYQGKIDWEKFADQGVRFAYIKATEGSGSVDENFADNVVGARAAGIAAGAYHFFSFDSPAQQQVENFVKTVPAGSMGLPPAIDLEQYRSENLPEPDTVRENLRVMLDSFEETYGKLPVIYTTKSCYEEYLQNTDLSYSLWIRSVFSPPSKDLIPAWTFWQYNPRGVLEGYEGGEPFIDLDVFAGSEEEFWEFADSKTVP